MPESFNARERVMEKNFDKSFEKGFEKGFEKAEQSLRARIVGAFLRETRQKAGLTQEELAKQLAYKSAQFVSNWERGISLPPMTVLPKICVLCRVSPTVMVDVLYRYQEAALKIQRRHLKEIMAREVGRAKV